MTDEDYNQAYLDFKGQLNL